MFSWPFRRWMEVFLSLTGEVSTGVLAQWVRCLHQWEGKALPPHTQICTRCQAPAIILLENERDKLDATSRMGSCWCFLLTDRHFCNAQLKRRAGDKCLLLNIQIFSFPNFLPPSLYSANLPILFICNTTYLHWRCSNKTLSQCCSPCTLPHTQKHTHGFIHCANLPWSAYVLIALHCSELLYSSPLSSLLCNIPPPLWSQCTRRAICGQRK